MGISVKVGVKGIRWDGQKRENIGVVRNSAWENR